MRLSASFMRSMMTASSSGSSSFLDFAMPEPWGPLPFPTRGDDDEALTHEGVGRVMSAWEAIEFELSRTYSIFESDPDGPSIQDYGKGLSNGTEPVTRIGVEELTTARVVELRRRAWRRAAQRSAGRLGACACFWWV